MSALNVDTLAKADATLRTPAETIHYGTCRSRLRVNQVGTQTILDSFNISSITDVSAGRTTGNFANAMAGADWTGLIFSNGNASATLTASFQGAIIDRDANGFLHWSAGSGNNNASIYCDNVVFGDLA